MKNETWFFIFKKPKQKLNTFQINIMFNGKSIQYAAGKMIAIKSQKT